MWSVFAAHKDQESLGAGLDDRAEELGEQQHHGSIKNLFSVLRVLVAGIAMKCTEEKALIHWCYCNSRQYGKESSHLPGISTTTPE